MTSPRSVTILANCQREAAVACARDLQLYLESRGLRVSLPPDLAETLGIPDHGAADGELGGTDFVLALGGDGTLLAANRFAAPHAAPILGVHMGGPGSFGFLTETKPHQAREAVDAVLNGRCRVEERLMVRGEVVRQGDVVAGYDALNEIVLRGEVRMLKMRVAIGDTYIATYAADGIIVATPTGSTAYNLAAGGPLVHPAVESILLTPICPHTLNIRSMLAGAEDVITVGLDIGEREATLLIVDGQVSAPIQPQDQVRFRRSALRGRFLSVDGPNFYERLQTRLRLGERFGA